MDTTSQLESAIFFGGGTGGHLVPGLAIAERARERLPSFRALFVRGGRAVEDRVLAESPFPTHTLSLPVPRGVSGRVRYSSGVLRAIPALRRLLREGEGFDVAIGLGGYVSLPGIIAAKREGIPVALLEQNRVAGKVNRWLSSWVDAVLCSDSTALPSLSGRGRTTGNPVRRRVLEAASRRDGRLTGRRAKRQILVVGGSQGALGLDRRVLEALPALREYRSALRWIHVSGASARSELESAYRAEGWEAEVCSYRHDLPDLVAESDFVISRAGGTTLSELSVIGVPSLLVPYPHHVDRHQWFNARRFEDAGAAILIEEHELAPKALRRVIEDTILFSERLRQMALAARGLARPDAADVVLESLIELRETCRSDFAYCS